MVRVPWPEKFMKSKIEEIINQAAAELCNQQCAALPANFNYDLQPPKGSQRGDLACNAAFKLTKALRKKPAEVAETILQTVNLI